MIKTEKIKTERLKYSGASSKRFWKRIHSIHDENLRNVVYIAGCALQDHEQRMIQILREAESSERETADDDELTNIRNRAIEDANAAFDKFAGEL